eukprot:12887895-Prorocentrum_lima.AAC.1
METIFVVTTFSSPHRPWHGLGCPCSGGFYQTRTTIICLGGGFCHPPVASPLVCRKESWLPISLSPSQQGNP